MKAATLKTGALALATCASCVAAAPAAASASQVSRVKAVYKSVMLAEYFGPARGVCAHLTAKGKKDYELQASRKTCTGAYKTLRYELHHKTKGVDNSGYTPAGWRKAVNYYVAHLTVRINGTKATAVGPSGIPGKTTLIDVKGRWIFTSAPPSPQS